MINNIGKIYFDFSSILADSNLFFSDPFDKLKVMIV
jgi:hypothetical protein